MTGCRKFSIARGPLRGALACAGLSLVVLGAPLQAQRATVDVVIGARQFSDGTGMVAAELRAGVTPRGWPLRPTVGIAGATDTYGSQVELLAGAHADRYVSNVVQLTGGLGGAWVRQDGGEWNSGSSTGLYAQGAVLFRLPPSLGGMGLGLDARYLAASAFTRADGLEQEISFLQWGAIVRFGGGRRAP